MYMPPTVDSVTAALAIALFLSVWMLGGALLYIRRLRRSRVRLSASSELFGNVLDSIDDAVYILNVDGTFRIANKACVRVFDLPPFGADKVTRIDIMRQSHDDCDDIVSLVAKAFSGYPSARQWSRIYPNGKTAYFIESLFPLKNKDAVEGVIGIVKNVTADREIKDFLVYQDTIESQLLSITRMFVGASIQSGELSIRQALAMVGYTLKSDRVYVYAASAGGHFERRYAWVSREAREVRDDVDVFDAVKSTFHDAFMREEVVAAEDAAASYETHPTLGSFFSVRRVKSFLYVPIVSRGGMIGCMMLETIAKNQVWDSHATTFVTLLSKVFAAYLERVTVEAALARGKEFDVFISDKLEMCVFWWQRGAETIDVNRHWASMMGHRESTGAVSFKDLEMLVHEDDLAVTRKTLSAFAEGKILGIDRTLRVMTQGGDYRWLWVRAEALERDELGLPIRAVGVTVDISDRMNVMNELEERRLQSQNLESLRVLAGGVAHDFNNILAVVSGNTELILRKNSDEAVHAHAYKIIDAVKKARSLASQMLTYSGRNSVVTEVIDLNRTVRGILSLLEVNIANKSDLQLNIADDFYWVAANATQVRQVTMNLVSNAAEAMQGKMNGLIAIETEQRMCPEEFLNDVTFKENAEPGMYVCLRVQDNGSGMSKEIQKKIFEPFFTTKFAGRGLGLAAVWGIVRSAKGFIRVESIVNHGTIFEVYFPTAPEREILRKQEELSAMNKRRTLLLVETSGRKDYILRDMLDELEWNVFAAENENEAAVFLKKHTDPVMKILIESEEDADAAKIFHRLKRIAHDQLFVLILGKKDYSAFGLDEDDLQRIRFAVRPFGVNEFRRVLDV